jgi:hypothetical protein
MGMRPVALPRDQRDVGLTNDARPHTKIFKHFLLIIIILSIHYLLFNAMSNDTLFTLATP